LNESDALPVGDEPFKTIRTCDCHLGALRVADLGIDALGGRTPRQASASSAKIQSDALVSSKESAIVVAVLLAAILSVK
jgi:hypothetical protein